MVASTEFVYSGEASRISVVTHPDYGEKKKREYFISDASQRFTWGVL